MRFFVTSGGAGGQAGYGSGGLDASREALAKQLIPVLRRLGTVKQLNSVGDGIRRARWAGAGARHLCLAYPHELPDGAGAETIPVFGLGLAACPTAPFANVARTDWRGRLERCGGAICFSSHAASAVRALMGDAYPVATVPAPVEATGRPLPPSPQVLQIEGLVLDTACWPDTAPADAPAVADEEDDAAWPDQAVPAWRKTARYRLGVTRQHLAQAYREAVHDLLPAPVATLVARTGRTGARTARRLLTLRQARQRPAAAVLAEDEFPAWRDGTHAVALDGLVFAAVHGVWDRGWGDVLSAFVAVCRDDPAATLVIKASGLDVQSRAGLAGYVRRLGPFTCRIVILGGTIEGGLDTLAAAASFTVGASHGEAAPLPMMRFMAAGRPAVSPAHSALADFVDAETGFVVACSTGYETWPGDVEERLAGTGWRPEWDSLCRAMAAACELARTPDAYAERARATARRMRAVCGADAAQAALASLLPGHQGKADARRRVAA